MNLKEYNLSLSHRTIENLEDAIALVMDEKTINQQAIIYIVPADKEINAAWDKKDWWIRTSMAYSNLPIVETAKDFFDYSTDMPELIASVKDHKAYIAALTARICREFEIKPNVGWDLSVIRVDSDSEVYLLIDPEHWNKAKAAVASYNAQAQADGYSALSTDDDLKMVNGQFNAKPVKGGFFEKRKIKKQNAEQEKAFWTFLASLDPFQVGYDK